MKSQGAVAPPPPDWRHDGLTRRQFVERTLGVGLAASAVGGLVAACGGEPAPTASPSPSFDTTLPKELNLYNWSDYMTRGIKEGFREKYGIEVVEDYFDDSETLMAKVKAGVPGWDVVILSDFWLQFLARNTQADAGDECYLRPLHMDLIPNASNVLASLASRSVDCAPNGQRYGVPYQWGATGIAVRKDKVDGRITRWVQLFPPQGNRFRGDILMLNEVREAFAAALLKNGCSISTTDQAELDAAKRDLIAQKPLVRAYDFVNMGHAIMRGVPLVHSWNGDCLKARRKLGGDTVAFVLPKEGFPAWTDNMCIPTTARSPYAAHLFIDYLCDPQVNAELSNFTGYSSPIAGAASYLDADILALTPTEKEMQRAQFFENLGKFSRAYNDAWAEVKSA